MERVEKIKFKIATEILNSYVKSINMVKEPMRKMKEQLSKQFKPMSNDLNSINNMSNIVKSFLKDYPNEKKKYSLILLSK